MRLVDQLKFAILVVAIAIWAWGAKTHNQAFMITGIAFVIVAFALRLIPRSKGGDDL